MSQKFSFLCGNFEQRNFIYAIKSASHPWHYFDELDTYSSEHYSLPTALHYLISTLKKVRSIEVTYLNEEQTRTYYDNGKFIFKNKELKTHMELANKKPEDQPESSPISSYPNTTKLTFISGQTNPLLFLNEFEKCRDLKTDKDKMFKIRTFVDEFHKAEFSQLFFTSDWPTVKLTFLRKYSSSFVANKKRELNVNFNAESTLRSFVSRKLLSLSTYTTLPFINQMEIVLYDLPNEISKMFIINEKLTRDKTNILDFCDSIQDLVATMHETLEEEDPQTNQNNQHSNQSLNQMEIFNSDEDIESDESILVDNTPKLSRVHCPGTTSRGRGAISGKIVKRGRPSKKLKTIPEDSESSGYEFLKQMENSSRSSCSDATSSM